MAYVRSASVDGPIFDFPNKTLVIEFKEPMSVTSTLEGERQGISRSGTTIRRPLLEHQSPTRFRRSRNRVCKAIGKAGRPVAFSIPAPIWGTYRSGRNNTGI